MKNRIGLRSSAVCVCLVVLLAVSFGKQPAVGSQSPTPDELKKQVEANLKKLLPCSTTEKVLVVLEGGEVTLQGSVPSGRLANGMPHKKAVESVAEARLGKPPRSTLTTGDPLVEPTISCPIRRDMRDAEKRKDFADKLKIFVEDRLKSRRACGQSPFQVDIQDDGVKLKLTIRDCPRCPNKIRKIVKKAIDGLDCVENVTPARAPQAQEPCDDPPCPGPDLRCGDGFKSCLDIDGNQVCIHGNQCPPFN